MTWREFGPPIVGALPPDEPDDIDKPVRCLGCSRALGDHDDDGDELCAMCLEDDDLVDELAEMRSRR